MKTENKIKVIGSTDKNGYEKTNWVYSIYHIGCTLSARDYKDPPELLSK